MLIPRILEEFEELEQHNHLIGADILVSSMTEIRSHGDIYKMVAHYYSMFTLTTHIVESM
jgi:hypothetical protein